MQFVIDGMLPTLNEIIHVSKKHWSEYHRMKKTYTELVAYASIKLPKIENKVDINIIWYVKDRRMDPDNISAGQKFILDGLVAAKKLKNDGWNEIGSITHDFQIDKHHPRVEVELIER